MGMTPPCSSRFFGCLLASLVFGECAWSQASDVSKDARLQKPISIKLKIVQIGDAISKLSKISGVPLDRSPAIKDLKVTVLVHEVPAGLVLDKIAKTLGCEWKADGQLFRLVMNPDEQTARTRYSEAEEDAAQKEIAAELDTISRVSNMDPAAAQKELLDLESAKNGSKPPDPDRIDLLKHAMNRQDIMLGRFLSDLSNDKLSAFWRGDVVGVPPNLAEQKFQEPTATGLAGPAPVTRGLTAPGASMSSMPLFVQYDPLLYRVQALQGFGIRYIAKRLGKIITSPLPAGALANMTFGKEVLSWDMPVPTDGDLTKLTIQPSKSPSQYSNHLYSIADFLEKAFDQSQVPIIADAFRVPALSKDFDRGVGEYTSWLSNLKKDNSLTTRFEDGFVLVRHGGFWRLRKFETPEEQIAVLEAKVSKTGPTLEDYGAFVSKLSPEQAKPFCIRNGSLVKFDTTPIERGLPALKFFAELDRGSIEKATQDGIAFAQMSAALRESFTDAAIQGVFFGASPSSFNLGLVNFAATGDGRGLGFLMRTGDVTRPDGAIGPAQDLVFGSSLTEATIYKLPVGQ